MSRKALTLPASHTQTMRLVFLNTYPLYHDGLERAAWLALENRDKWLPDLAAAQGHTVELWAGDRPGAPMTTTERPSGVTVRLFPADPSRRGSKHHSSRALTDYAAQQTGTAYVLKGVDGGLGLHLTRRHLRPSAAPYAYIIGGKVYAPPVAGARAVLYETEAQADLLAAPPRSLARPFPTPLPRERLVRLPKTLDLEVFRPHSAEKDIDVLVIGRLIGYYKSYDVLEELQDRARVAVIGDGPERAGLEAQMPRVEWMGAVPFAEIPKHLSRARLFFHTSHNDYYPRVITEALACGVPVAAYADAIAADVLPPDVGLRVREGEAAESVAALLADGARLRRLAEACRPYAERTFAPGNLAAPLAETLRLLGVGV